MAPPTVALSGVKPSIDIPPEMRLRCAFDLRSIPKALARLT